MSRIDSSVLGIWCWQSINHFEFGAKTTIPTILFVFHSRLFSNCTCRTPMTWSVSTQDHCVTADLVGCGGPSQQTCSVVSVPCRASHRLTHSVSVKDRNSVTVNFWSWSSGNVRLNYAKMRLYVLTETTPNLQMQQRTRELRWCVLCESETWALDLTVCRRRGRFNL